MAAEVPLKEYKAQDPHQGSQFQWQEEESTQKLVVKISGDSDAWVRRKKFGNPDIPLKGPRTDTLDSNRGTVAREAPETYRERLSCLVSGPGLE